MSQYIANLNTIPSAHDLDSPQQDDYSLEDDLALFTNTEFFDFDAGGNIEQSLANYNPTQDGQARGEDVAVKYNNNDVTGLDLNNGTCTSYMYSLKQALVVLKSSPHSRVIEHDELIIDGIQAQRAYQTSYRHTRCRQMNVLR